MLLLCEQVLDLLGMHLVLEGHHVGPLMRHEDINKLLRVAAFTKILFQIREKRKFLNLILPIVINALDFTLAIRELFMESLLEVPMSLDSADSSQGQDRLWYSLAINSTSIHHNIYNASSSKEVDVLSSPATIVQLPQVVARLMVPTDEDGKNRCFHSAIVVLVKLAELLVLIRNRDGRHIPAITKRLEVTTAEHKVHRLTGLLLMLKDVFIHLVE